MKKSDQIGWIFAAALVAVAFASGFQDTTQKTGVVNIGKLVADSAFGKTIKTNIDKMADTRKEMLKFINDNGVMTPEQFKTFKELSLNLARTPADDAKLSQLKADVAETVKKFQALLQKPNPTPEDKAILSDYQGRSQYTRSVGEQMVRDFQTELDTFSDEQTALCFDKAKSAVQEVAKAQGYTTVFDTRFAPYGTNDVTDQALQAMDAKK